MTLSFASSTSSLLERLKQLPACRTLPSLGPSMPPGAMVTMSIVCGFRYVKQQHGRPHRQVHANGRLQRSTSEPLASFRCSVRPRYAPHRRRAHRSLSSSARKYVAGRRWGSTRAHQRTRKSNAPKLNNGTHKLSARRFLRISGRRFLRSPFLPGGRLKQPGSGGRPCIALMRHLGWARTQRTVGMVVQRIVQRVEAGRARLDLVPVSLPVAVQANRSGGDVCTAPVSAEAQAPRGAGAAPAMFTFWRTSSPAARARRVSCRGARQARGRGFSRTGRLSQEAQRRIRRAVQHRSRRVRNWRWRVIRGAGLRRRRLQTTRQCYMRRNNARAAGALQRACPYCGAYWGCPPY